MVVQLEGLRAEGADAAKDALELLLAAGLVAAAVVAGYLMWNGTIAP